MNGLTAGPRRLVGGVALGLAAATAALGAENFPPPEFSGGQTFPKMSWPAPRPELLAWVDVAVLAVCLGLAAVLALRVRSRPYLALLAGFGLLYFGFFRRGCVCPVGAIQNVALALGDSSITLPLTVALIFALPLLFALVWGRVFCSGVCPLGAAQELVLLRPVRVPAWLDQALGVLPFVYLGVGALYAWVGSVFLICQYDPFVLFFRLGGSMGMLAVGAGMLLLSMFVGRPYCRYLCPLSALLRLAAPLAAWRVKITRGECVNCHLCATACPYGAIRPPTPEREVWDRSTARRRLGWTLLALPVLIAGGAWLVHLAAPQLARLDSRVRLAERLWLEEQGRVEGHTLATEAWHAQGRPPVEAYAEAVALRNWFGQGSWWLGGWLGLVIGWRLLALSVRRRRLNYEIDPAACVACGRCFASCPVDRHPAQALSGESREGL